MHLTALLEEFLIALLAGLSLFVTEAVTTTPHDYETATLKGIGAFAAALAIALRARFKMPPITYTTPTAAREDPARPPGSSGLP